MNVTEEVLLRATISLADQITSYLYETNRVLKAIELSKEQLFLLDHKSLKNAEKELVVIHKLKAYTYIFLGYSCTNQTRLEIDYGRKLLDLTRENNLREVEGVVSFALAKQYADDPRHVNEAKELCLKALSIATETGRKENESDCYAMLLVIFIHFGEHFTAKEYGEKAIAIAQKIGKKTRTEFMCYDLLGEISRVNGEYVKAKEYKEKALEIAQEIGDRKLEAPCYASIAKILLSGNDHEYVKAKEFQEKALAIAQEIGDKETEAKCYVLLGALSLIRGVPGKDIVKAKHYLERALVLRRETGSKEGEANIHMYISGICLLEGNFPEAKLHCLACIKQGELFRSFLNGDDQIAYFDSISSVFQFISYMLCFSGNPHEGLYTEEIGRARALEDLMSAQYSIENEIPVSPETWVGIEKIMKKESNCVCLYISYFKHIITLLVVKADNQVIAKQVDITDYFAGKGSESRVDDFFCSDIYRKVRCLAPELCEDRSWFSSNVQQERKGEPSQGNSPTAARLCSEEDENIDDQQPILTLADGYKMIMAPVAHEFDKPEIIIVPYRSFFKVPFAALKDERGRCLSQSFRIRIAPSLTTLQLIQDSPSDYHSQTGALIVGDPDVGEVLYKENLHRIKRLPSAGEEAKMVGELIGTQPLLGKQATKQMVLQRINSLSLIHFACHGDTERGEIILASPPLTDRKPNEKDYLLTMGKISKVRLRAKLVVLSCCHSAQGQICSEGVVGIARAFIGSGARSVLVALWAIQDEATKHFMSCFYKHLVRGESASESLYQAMKWMRENKFSDVEQWAPFMLVGDNVTLDFQKLRLVAEMYGDITGFKLMMDNAFPAYRGINLIWVKRLVSTETLALHWPGSGGRW